MIMGLFIPKTLAKIRNYKHQILVGTKKIKTIFLINCLSDKCKNTFDCIDQVFPSIFRFNSKMGIQPYFLHSCCIRKILSLNRENMDLHSILLFFGTYNGSMRWYWGCFGPRSKSHCTNRFRTWPRAFLWWMFPILPVPLLPSACCSFCYKSQKDHYSRNI